MTSIAAPAQTLAPTTADPFDLWAERPLVRHIHEDDGSMMPMSTQLYATQWGGDTPTKTGIDFKQIDSLKGATSVIQQQPNGWDQAVAILQAKTGELFLAPLGSLVTGGAPLPPEPGRLPLTIMRKEPYDAFAGQFIAESDDVVGVFDASAVYYPNPNHPASA